MPKEIVRSDEGGYNVHVGWERDKFVQVGLTTNGDDKVLVPVVSAESDGAGNVTSRVEHVEADGVFATLTRDGLNRLIRSLRKARDQAYGADA